MDLSLIVPVYNEEENLPLLYPAVLGRRPAAQLAWEVVLVDDGSRDRSVAELEELAAATPRTCAWWSCAATSARPPPSPPGSTIPAARSSS